MQTKNLITLAAVALLSSGIEKTCAVSLQSKPFEAKLKETAGIETTQVFDWLETGAKPGSDGTKFKLPTTAGCDKHVSKNRGLPIAQMDITGPKAEKIASNLVTGMLASAGPYLNNEHRELLKKALGQINGTMPLHKNKKPVDGKFHLKFEKFFEKYSGSQWALMTPKQKKKAPVMLKIEIGTMLTLEHHPKEATKNSFSYHPSKGADVQFGRKVKKAPFHNYLPKMKQWLQQARTAWLNKEGLA